MKKLKFNSTLNHKQSDYNTHEVIVEKVITLYGNHFSELRDHPLRDDPYIAENRDLMYIDSNDTAHCFPKSEREYILQDVLELIVPAKYWLSEEATSKIAGKLNS